MLSSLLPEVGPAFNLNQEAFAAKTGASKFDVLSAGEGLRYHFGNFVKVFLSREIDAQVTIPRKYAGKSVGIFKIEAGETES